MQSEVRFGDFARLVKVSQAQISYNQLAAKPELDSRGHPKPLKLEKLKVTPLDIYRILGPYSAIRFWEQVKAVVPLAVYLMLFQVLVLRQDVQDSLVVCGGLTAVMIGLMLFMEGLKLGLMPFGETIGHLLPVKKPLPFVLLIAFLLGVGVTFAEPAIGALKQAGLIVKLERAPFLYAILNQYSDWLVGLVGVGVGAAAVLGTLRFVYNWSLKPLIYLSLIPVLLVTAYIALFVPDLVPIIGLAWDCGAVTTGPVTVPLVLALGIGVAAAVGKGDSTLSGFGIVTLASLYPILGALLLGLGLSSQFTPDELIAHLQASATSQAEVSWYDQTPWIEIVLAARAIVPLVLFLLLIMKLILRERIKEAFITGYGIVLAVVGMGIFNIGLTYGLAKLGDQSGSLVPASFMELPHIAGSPLYVYALGLGLSLLFAFFLGFGATLAEPALNALGTTVQNLTNGAFKKSMLMYSVSFGVALGIALGVGKLVFQWPLSWMLIPGYLLLLLFTHLSSEEFVNVGWDSAGVTTGPVTVPLVLAMGLGFGNAMGIVEGFGILSMASLCPILSVLALGLYVQTKQKQKRQLAEKGV